MATHLYRLGGWAFRHRRAVLAGWLAILAGVIACATMFGGRTSDKFVVPGTESQQAQDLLEEKFPEASGATARVVYAAPAGEKVTDPENHDAIMASVKQAQGADGVMKVVDPFTSKAISKDGRIAYSDVIYPVPADEIEDGPRDELEKSADPAKAAGLDVEFGGGIVTADEHTNSESMGMMIGYVILAITLGSLLAAGMPLLTAIIGVAIGITGLTALSGVIELSSTAPTLATMLGLAVGIDYALFILSRYRQNLGDGMAPAEAAANATATAGSAVVFAGATVIIALVGLVVVQIPFLTVMGLAAAGTVAIAVVIALTLLPALLGFAGMRVSRVNRVLGYRPGGARRRTKEPLSVRWATMITRRPLLVSLACVALLGAIAVPALHLKLGLPDDGSKPTSTTERRAYDLLASGFGPGFAGTLTGVVEAPGLSASEREELANGIIEDLEGTSGVAAVSPAVHNSGGDVAVVTVTPESGPASDATKDLVTLLRSKADAIPESAGVTAYVTGTTALNIDTSDRLSAALPRYIAVVVGLALFLLMVVFRSILVPVKAVGGFLLSIAASMGLTVFVFQDGHFGDLFNVAQAGPIVSFLPVLMIGILFGLAMDYEVFLVSRMRENFVRSGRPRESVIKGFGQSGRVVTAAALIMTAVFGAFILDTDPVIKSIGLALAFGVLADAFVVRMTLVPALMALMGKTAWKLPRRLDRVMPDVDIEGERLAEGLRATA
jgi:putative drug exporter of the RND superfamily